MSARTNTSHTHTHAHTHTHTRARTRTNPRKHTHTPHTRTHAHTHTTAPARAHESCKQRRANWLTPTHTENVPKEGEQAVGFQSLRHSREIHNVREEKLWAGESSKTRGGGGRVSEGSGISSFGDIQMHSRIGRTEHDAFRDKRTRHQRHKRAHTQAHTHTHTVSCFLSPTSKASCPDSITRRTTSGGTYLANDRRRTYTHTNKQRTHPHPHAHNTDNDQWPM